jgi:hypothetical protein
MSPRRRVFAASVRVRRPTAHDRALAALSRMTLPEKVGQLFVTVNPNLRIRSAVVPSAPAVVAASDHRPVVATVRLP